jgi:ferrochelatase
MKRKVKVIIAQLGSPKSPKTNDVRKYLKDFLGDYRVVDISPFVWKIILNLFVLPFRPKQSGKAYARIWDGKSFPLITITLDFVEKLKKHVKSNKDTEVDVIGCFALSEPRLTHIVKSLDEDIDEVIFIPMFPQYSESTSASFIDALFRGFQGKTNIPSLITINQFHRAPAFIDNTARLINDFLKENPVDELVLSFHGMPKRRIIYKYDRYYQHCYETHALLLDRIEGIPKENIHISFQSRFGSEEWITPYTDEYVKNLAKDKKIKIAIHCPAFVVDCLETIDEIGTELKHEIEEEEKTKECEILHVPCLNDDDKWVEDFSSFINQTINKESQILLEVPKEMKMPSLEMKSKPLSTQAKASIKIIFLTLFLDLVGFSIIFPMFPKLAEYYLTVDSDNAILKMIFGSINSLTNLTTSSTGMSPIVLFGGALGALYSLLQFIAAPIWGAISDRIGRKPVLIISLSGLFLSYVLWFFSGSFTLLIIARIVGGVMGGNISTATAVVADVTDRSNRSKGMAFVGIAFAFGFVFGPALGGALSLIDLTKIYPSLEAYGVNPFSVPAGLAAILSLLNVYLILKNFKETLPVEKRGKGELSRSANPLKLFKPLPFKDVNLTNWAYFLFITAFSGMEFTLTFVAVERFGYSPMDNAYMFIFIGFVLAMVQGGFVRRKAGIIGEKKVGLMGLVTVIPGLIIIAYASTPFLIYLGLFFLAVGSAMTIPTLTALVSIHTPVDQQGRSIGIFRSLGSLGRVFGPIMASLIYWKYGSLYPYLFGSISLILPIIVLNKVSNKAEEGLL